MTIAAPKIASACSGVNVGSWLGVDVGFGESVGEGELVGGRVGVDVGVGVAGASGFGAVKKGTKLTVPLLKSFLKS
jgi:hypothetical protein